MGEEFTNEKPITRVRRDLRKRFFYLYNQVKNMAQSSGMVICRFDMCWIAECNDFYHLAVRLDNCSGFGSMTKYFEAFSVRS